MELISVVMPVFNAASHLREAIISVLSQTYKNFEFIIIDDGSTDESLEIIQFYAALDSRIRLVSNGKMGLVEALNFGIDISKGLWIARMDADDICMKNRLERQIQFIKKNKLDMCGSWAKKFGKSEDSIVLPCSHDEIVVDLLFKSSFVHPSVIFKKRVFSRLKYNNSFKHAEDYHLWTQMVENGLRLGNIPEYLLQYREHGEQVSTTNSFAQQNMSNIVRSQYLNFFLQTVGINAGEFRSFVKNFNSLESLADLGCAMFLAVFEKLKGIKKNYFASSVGKLYAELGLVTNRALLYYLKFSFQTNIISIPQLVYMLVLLMLPKYFRKRFKTLCKRLILSN